MDYYSSYCPDDERTVVEQIVCSTEPYPGWVRQERENSDVFPYTLPAHVVPEPAKSWWKYPYGCLSIEEMWAL